MSLDGDTDEDEFDDDDLDELDDDLRAVFMRGADFTRATISASDFSGAALTAASFDGALLDGVTFAGADLSAATFDGTVILDPFAHAVGRCRRGAAASGAGNHRGPKVVDRHFRAALR